MAPIGEDGFATATPETDDAPGSTSRAIRGSSVIPPAASGSSAESGAPSESTPISSEPSQKGRRRRRTGRLQRRGTLSTSRTLWNRGSVSTELGLSRLRSRGPTTTLPEAGRESWRRLRAAFPMIRNPLVSIRTFTELLDEHYGDAEFRERFRDLVGRDVAHIDEVIARLSSAAAQEKVGRIPSTSPPSSSDCSTRYEPIGERRLLVLRELERGDRVGGPEGLEWPRRTPRPGPRPASRARSRRHSADRSPPTASSACILLRHHDPNAAAAANSGPGIGAGSATTAPRNVSNTCWPKRSWRPAAADRRCDRRSGDADPGRPPDTGLSGPGPAPPRPARPKRRESATGMLLLECLAFW